MSELKSESIEIFLTAAQVSMRYGGKSHMWLLRRMEKDAFPSPIRLGRLRHWKKSELVAWEEAQAAKPAPATPGFKSTIA